MRAGSSAVWTFRTSAARQGRLPVPFAAYDADLDRTNSAPAAADFALKVCAGEQGGGRAEL
ncbi:hypothetical protein ACFY0A_27260 [Streptomyces sp. NPDC001698]|uniref:hypothetical protein n=1 Tax=unclassified Streptomyces TaxID=2593676 RepID=UPI0036B923AB